MPEVKQSPNGASALAFSPESDDHLCTTHIPIVVFVHLVENGVEFLSMGHGPQLLGAHAAVKLLRVGVRYHLGHVFDATPVFSLTSTCCSMCCAIAVG